MTSDLLDALLDLPKSDSNNFSSGSFADPNYLESSAPVFNYIKAPIIVPTDDTRAKGYKVITMDTTNILVRSLTNRKNQVLKNSGKKEASKRYFIRKSKDILILLF
jgi:hypothetical protein